MAGVGRKDLCPCGSGKRYKHCCGQKDGWLEQKALPGNAALHYKQGHRAHLGGNKVEAIRHYQATLLLQPEHADAMHYLGMLLMESGRLLQAQGLVSRSLELKPKDADFWANAALVEQALGKLDEAVSAYRKSIQLARGDAVRHMLLGSLLLYHGRTGEAISELEQSCRLKPGQAQSWLLLGNAHMKQNPPEYGEAIRCFQAVLKLDPQNIDVRVSLATAYAMTQKRTAALANLQEAALIAPTNFGVLSNLGKYWLDAGSADEAVITYRQLVALYPGVVEGYVKLGCALKSKGEFGEAEAVFHRAWQLNADDIEVLTHLIDVEVQNSPSPNILSKAMEVADRAELTKKNLAGLCFALGKLLDKKNSYQSAFKYFAKANQISSMQSPFDCDSYRTWVDGQITVFNKKLILELQKYANFTKRPIYIVGMPRSGTTLTDQILSSHSRIAGGGERAYWPCVDKGLLPEALRAENGKLARQLSEDCLVDLTTVNGANVSDFVTDKMPDNFKRLGLIHGLMPNARFIHIRRNPADTCLSIYFQNFKGHEYGSDLETLASYYREYRRLMEHWRDILPKENLLEFDYEDLIADQEGVSRRLIEFCGLDWEPTCLEFYENKNAVRTASLWQVRQKLYSGSVGRWQRYAAYIQPLLALNVELGGCATADMDR